MLSKKKQNLLLIGFFLCVAWDIFTMNYHWAFASDPDKQYSIFILCNSLNYLFYTLYIHLLARCIANVITTKPWLILKIATMNWIAFAFSDVIDVVSGHGSDIYWLEYAGFVISIPLTVWEIKTKWKHT